MGNKYQPKQRPTQARKQPLIIQKEPRRGEIWLAIDRDDKDDGKQKFDSSVQGGTRTCVIVSNNDGNTFSSVVEVVYTTTKNKTNLPTHFKVDSTPEPSTVLCEQIMTIPKKDLKKYYGTLFADEIPKLDRCLKVSLGLK